MTTLLGQLVSRFNPKGPGSVISWPQVYLSDSVVQNTAQLISSYGKRGIQHEGIAYWAGVECERVWIVLTVLAPFAMTTPGSYMTNPVANAMVVAKVNEFGLHILAQIHGHPGDWVGHSDGDNRGAFMPYHGFYSVVVPRYGKQGLMPLAQCGIHRFQRNQFVQLTPNEIQRQFILVPDYIDLRKSK